MSFKFLETLAPGALQRDVQLGRSGMEGAPANSAEQEEAMLLELVMGAPEQSDDADQSAESQMMLQQLMESDEVTSLI